jgi:hypothetical protein
MSVPFPNLEIPPTFCEIGFESILDEELASNSSLLQDGSGTVVTSFESSQGLVVVRRPSDLEINHEPHPRFLKRIAGLWVGRQITGLETVVYYSTEDQVAITKHAGITADSLPPEVMRQITAKNWFDTITTIVAAHSAGIMLDDGGANTVYALETGFTHIDYELANAQELKKQSMWWSSNIDPVLHELDVMLNDNLFYNEGVEGVRLLALSATLSHPHYSAEDSPRIVDVFMHMGI